MTRKFLTSSCVLTAGLVVGFGVPRPKWAAEFLSRMTGGDGEAAQSPKVVSAAALEPLAARDSAESTELKALRAAEEALFPEIPASPKPVSRMKAQPKLCGPGDDSKACKQDDPQLEASDGQADWMVGLRMPDIPVKADSRVERFVRYFTQNTQGRKLFRGWLKRSGRYRTTVATALREQNLPQDLHALVFIESGYSPSATSTAGAAGLWQLMPETGRIYGLAVEEDYDERRSIEKSTTAAVKHLHDLYGKFGTWDLAFAAYDMGYKGVLGRVRDLSSNDFWTMASIEGALPREAVLYVPKVLAVSLILKNLDRYGFDDTHIEGPVATADLEVPSGVDLATVARASGTSLQHLRQLNPEMLTDVVPDRGAKFAVHIPPGGISRAGSLLASLLDKRDRDGLEDNAPAEFDWGQDELPPGGNPRRSASRKSPLGGEEEYDPLPHPGGRSRRHHVLPPLAQQDDEAPTSAPRAGAGRQDDDLGVDRETIFYRVGENETLASIGRAFGARPDDIIDDNHLDPAARLQKGMVLKLRVAPTAMSRIARRRASARLSQQDEQDSGAATREPQYDGASPAPSHGRNASPEADDPARPSPMLTRPRASGAEAGSGGGASASAEPSDMLDAFALALSEPRHKRGAVHLHRPRPLRSPFITLPTAPPPPKKHTKRNDDP